MCEAYGSKAKQDLVAAGLRRAQLVSLRDVSHQRELEELKARRQQGREQQALARSRVAERDREAFQQAQRRGARRRQERRRQLRESAFGSGGLFGDGVSAVPSDGVIVPCSPQEIIIRDLSDVPRGSWESVRQVPLAGMWNIGETCYLNCVAQVLIRTPAMLEWLKRHVENGCPRAHGDCVMCGLKQTYDQMLRGIVGRRSVVPVIAARRRAVGPEFSDGQHDAVSFLEQFLDRARDVEVQYDRYGLWRGLQQTHPVATQVDRLFGFVQETRRQCMECRGTVRSWYANEKILRVSPELQDGGPATMAELYLASCGQHETSVVCHQCGRDTVHRTHVRMMTAPNVLAIHVRRQEGARVPVAVEQQLDLPGCPLMELVGVVYHNGQSFQSGHYTCLCRGPGGRFWSYDDSRPVHREVREIAHVKPKQVVLAVYARSDGAAVWAQPGLEAGEPAVARIDEVVEILQADPQAVVSSASVGTPRRLRRKSSCEVRSPSHVVDPVLDSMAVVTPTQMSGTCLPLSPPSRRLKRKTSATETSCLAPSCPETPKVSGMASGVDEARAASPGATLASPGSRRLRRKISAEEAASVTSPAALLSSPGSRRLRRKTSAEDEVQVSSTSLSGTRVSDAAAQARGVTTLRRGRAGQVAPRDLGRDGGSGGR